MLREQTMQGETENKWRKLCEQATVEQDPQTLLELVREINRLLDEKEQPLTQTHKTQMHAA